MEKSIYINTVEDALMAYEIMQEYYGDCELRLDECGYHLVALGGQ